MTTWHLQICFQCSTANITVTHTTFVKSVQDCSFKNRKGVATSSAFFQLMFCIYYHCTTQRLHITQFIQIWYNAIKPTSQSSNLSRCVWCANQSCGSKSRSCLKIQRFYVFFDFPFKMIVQATTSSCSGN